MNRFISVLYILLLLPFSILATNVELAVFDLNNYDGWQYNRVGSGFELNQFNISHLHIKLYHDYTLTSPAIECSGLDSLHIKVGYNVDAETKNFSKLALTCSFSNADGVAADTTLSAKAVIGDQFLEASFPINDGSYTLKLAALKADINNNAAVRSVKISGIKNDKVNSADVNGDGSVDITDINAVINAIMTGNDVFVTDANGDGITDIADVNTVVNGVLNN